MNLTKEELRTISASLFDAIEHNNCLFNFEKFPKKKKLFPEAYIFYQKYKELQKKINKELYKE